MQFDVADTEQFPFHVVWIGMASTAEQFLS